ncbi:MAG: HEPN domain-containing protein [Clostridiales bacterium]|nr:HEPN domain-containing protein [Clostridiales bacterium]
MLRNDVKSWVVYAKNDIDVAIREMEYIRNPRLRPYEIILHHCHQCAEKMLKAYILSYGGSLAPIHVLNTLRRTCSAYDDSFNGKRMIDHCVYLDTFWNIKYPDFTVSVDASHATRGLNSAKRIYDFVSVKLGLGKEYTR